MKLLETVQSKEAWAFVVCVCKTFIGFRVRQSKESKENLACCTKLGPVSSK